MSSEGPLITAGTTTANPSTRGSTITCSFASSTRIKASSPATCCSFRDSANYSTPSTASWPTSASSLSNPPSSRCGATCSWTPSVEGYAATWACGFKTRPMILATGPMAMKRAMLDGALGYVTAYSLFKGLSSSSITMHTWSINPSRPFLTLYMSCLGPSRGIAGRRLRVSCIRWWKAVLMNFNRRRGIRTIMKSFRRTRNIRP